MNRKSNNKWAMLLAMLTIVTGFACTNQKKSDEQIAEQAVEEIEVSQDELEALALALPKYNQVENFHEGLAAVCDKETTLWGFIDKTGKEVIPCLYQYIPVEFNEGVAIVCTTDERMQIIDHEGKVIAPFDYVYKGDGFHDGLIAFVEVNDVGEDDEIDWQHWGKAGFIDTKGKVVIPADTYDVMMGEGPLISNFSDGLCRQNLDGKCVYIDTKGKVVIECNSSFGDDFSEGLVSVWKFNESKDEYFYGFIDKTGKEVIPHQFTTVGSFSEGLCFVSGKGKSGFIDKNGKWVIEGDYQVLRLYEDTEGEEDLCPNFSEGLAWVCNSEGKFGYIDKTGKTAVPFRYEPGYSEESEWFEEQPCYDFKGGIARVWDKATKMYGFIDREGKEIFPCQFDGAEDMSEGLALINRGGQYGFIDAKGNCTLDLKK